MTNKVELEMEEGIEFENTGEDIDEEPIDIKGREIRADSSDPEIDSLYRRWQRGKLILQPDFQRHFVWDRKKASRLIESALLAVPLPIIYLAKESNSNESVIDGQQRLTSFFSFVNGNFPDGEVFRLTDLDVFKELNKKTFQELDSNIQDKILQFHIRTITILPDSDPNLKFKIFERLNTGAVALNDMELRNCVYRGNYMQLLKELANDQDFKSLLGLSKPDKRMGDVELVLRFAAFFHATYLKYLPPIRRFLNQDMIEHQNISNSKSNELRFAFKNTVQLVKSLFGREHAFKRFYKGVNSDKPNGYWEPKKFNASLYDVLMGVLWDKDKNQVMQALDSLREGLIDLISTNEEFIDAIEKSTSAKEKVRKRFDLTRKVVEDILQEHPKQPRCFSYKLKKDLFDSDSTCAICKQRIVEIDDAAVDHIRQYWMGGTTIPENARLTHRYCNFARPRND